MSTAADTGTLAEKVARPSRSQQMVLDVLIAAHRNHIAPLTAGEMRQRLEMLHAPRRFDTGWVTGRLDELRDKGVVQKLDERRFDPQTKKASHLWQIPES